MPLVVQLLHYAFLACLPAAVILAISGRWVLGAVVFVVGTPLFWTLRNAAMAATIEEMEEMEEIEREEERRRRLFLQRAVEDAYLSQPAEPHVHDAWPTAHSEIATHLRYMHKVDPLPGSTIEMAGLHRAEHQLPYQAPEGGSPGGMR